MTTTEIQMRLSKLFNDHALEAGLTVRLCMTGEAYCSGNFDRIYDEHASVIGHRPKFMVGKAFGEEGMVVMTTSEDATHAVKIIMELEASVR